MRRLVLALVLVLAGCGGSAGKKTTVNHHQPQLVARATGKAAERIGERLCRKLPPGTLPSGDRDAKVAALRAYLQNVHPTNAIEPMLRGCLRTAKLG
jgi:hypothetical protein